MIKFIDNSGNIYEGQSPYIHWVNGGGQSVGLWYDIKLMVISDDNSPLICTGLSDESAFKFVDKTKLVEGVELSQILETTCLYSDDDIITIENVDYHIYQVIILCKSNNIGQFVDTFKMTAGESEIDVLVGADFYDLNEILSINLSNKGTDLPIYVEKALYDSNYNEANLNSILINQKFKELISNYIDIIDCKGSYKSLKNSLDWFDWGDNIKMYEVWKKSEDSYFEKNVELILSDLYKHLLYTQSKTTYLSLVTALQRFTDDVDEEKNPVIEDISRKWSKEEISIKVSILGAFFERYFMPIHMDLKRASAEALVCSIPVKVKCGEVIEYDNYLYDSAVVNIDMPPVNVLGNLSGVSVDGNTMFGRPVGDEDEDKKYITPIGVKQLVDITNESYEGRWDTAGAKTKAAYGQLIGGVGVVIPVTVSIDLPSGDGISVEDIVLYKPKPSEPISLTERKLFMSEYIYYILTLDNNKYSYIKIDSYELTSEQKQNAVLEKEVLLDPTDDSPEVIKISQISSVKFSFNLVSTTEETVSFTLTLRSLSGHTWTACATYKAVDVSGCRLDVFKIDNEDYTGDTLNFMDHMKGIPWASQYNTIEVDSYTEDEINEGEIIPEKYHGKLITQYIPFKYTDETISQYNELIVVKNPVIDTAYSYSWIDNNLRRDYWIWNRGEVIGGYHKYTYLIRKKGGNNDGTSLIPNLTQNSPIIERHDWVFIPQLHKYTNIMNIPMVVDENTGRYKINSFVFKNTDLLCVIPQFKKTLPIDDESVSWEFINKTTQEHIIYKYDNKNLNGIATPIIANNKNNFLSPGYWTIVMRFRFVGDGKVHEIVRDSAFKMES